LAKGKGEDKPPEATSLVKEILCPQLFLAMICGGAFAYTVAQPVSIPQITAPGVKQSEVPDRGGGDSSSIDNDKIFAQIDAVDCMVFYNKGEKEKAIAAALAIGKSREKRKSPVQLLAAGTVLLTSDSKQLKWKGNTLLEKAERIAAKSRYVKLVRARELFKQGRMSDAIEEYEACLNLSPEDWITPRLELANLFMMNEEGLKAIDMFKEVLKLKSDDPRILKRLGITMAVNSDHQGGFDKFIEGSNLEYDKPDYYPEIQKLVDDNAGLIENAINETRTAVEKNPDDVKKRITLARLLISVNRLNQAKEQLQEAQKRRETDPEIHEVLAECNYRMKLSADALAEFTTTARLEPLNKPAAPPNAKYLPTWEDLHEEEVLEKDPVDKTSEL
jgi:predicted Zn-dependent protease